MNVVDTIENLRNKQLKKMEKFENYLDDKTKNMETEKKLEVLKDELYVAENIINKYKDDKEYNLTGKILNTLKFSLVTVIAWISTKGILEKLVQALGQNIFGLSFLGIAVLFIIIGIYFLIISAVNIYNNDRIQNALINKYCIEKRKKICEKQIENNNTSMGDYVI
jgi:hypothetical protein